MAIVTYIEKDGKRIDVTGLEPVDQWRCDGCGEMLAETERFTADITIEAGVYGLAEAHVDAHAGHLTEATAKAAAALLNTIVPF